MRYRINEDILLIRKMLELSQEEMASLLGLSKMTILRIENGQAYPNQSTMDKIYDLAFRKGIKLNKIKEMFYKKEAKGKAVIFHGAKQEIDGDISPMRGKDRNDFGKGFYCGETIDQAISFISHYPNSSAYILSSDLKGLKKHSFEVNQEWMLAVAYHRGRLEKYKESPIIKKIIKSVEEADYVYAPIADNRMSMIIDQFIDGLITDEQCNHCLAATDLGYQYAFLSEKATSRVKILERCFISQAERDHFHQIKEADVKDGDNKVRAALIKYKRNGKYIEEILDESI